MLALNGIHYAATYRVDEITYQAQPVLNLASTSEFKGDGAMSARPGMVMV